MADVYLPYHRKLRPNCIEDYVGNERLKKGVMAALKGEYWPQVLMFNGNSGGGKTTFARLLAKEYMCENRDADKGACGECDSCRRMEEYIETGDADMVMNLTEVDITESRGVDAISELIEDMEVPSYDGSWKVFILDECHVLSQAAQNRLLKPIEEPAEKVLIILCTTDPEKLLDTIISRCQYIFKVEKPTRDEMCQFLAKVCYKEGLTPDQVDGRALSMIAVKGGFAFRKTLIELERVVREAGEVTYKKTSEILETIVDEEYFKFYECILKEPINPHEYLIFLGRMKQKVDFKSFMEGLLEFTMRGIYVANSVMVEALDKSELRKYLKIFNAIEVTDLANLLNILVEIKDSRDIEARLMYLGYTGIKKPTITQQADEINYLDMSKTSAAEEKAVGTNIHLDNITMKEEEKGDLIETQNKEMSVTDLAKIFGGKMVDMRCTPKL
jgi:DNA polymerase-3 subunit gamma/tau